MVARSIVHDGKKAWSAKKGEGGPSLESPGYNSPGEHAESYMATAEESCFITSS